MSRITPQLSIAISLLLVVQHSESSDFDCTGAKRLVDLLQEGPDRVVRTIERNPEKFVNRTMKGWQCVPDPFPPERNDLIYIEGLECIYSDMATPVTGADLSDAGRTYQKNMGEVIACFPENISSVPIDYSNTTTGEGILLAVGEDLKSDSGVGYQILVEYTYFQDSDGPIFWRVAAKIGSKTEDDPAKFCPNLRRILGEASRGFRKIRGRYDTEFDEYATSLYLPSADSCDIEKDSDDYTYSCSWYVRGNRSFASKLRSDIDREISTCLSDELVRVRDRTSDRGTEFRYYYLENERMTIRSTFGSRTDRAGDNVFSIRLYVEYDR